MFSISHPIIILLLFSLNIPQSNVSCAFGPALTSLAYESYKICTIQNVSWSAVNTCFWINKVPRSTRSIHQVSECAYGVQVSKLALHWSHNSPKRQMITLFFTLPVANPSLQYQEAGIFGGWIQNDHREMEGSRQCCAQEIRNYWVWSNSGIFRRCPYHRLCFWDMFLPFALPK